MSEKLPYQVQADVAPDKPAKMVNPEAPPTPSLSQQQAIARRNALVKELFRVVPLTHPAKEIMDLKVSEPKTPSTGVQRKEVGNLKDDNPAVDLEEQNIEQVEVNRKLHTINGVHLDLFSYFSIDVNTDDVETLKRLQHIDSWVATEGRNYTEGLRKLHKIDRQLGSADTGATKLIKIYNWLRFANRK